MQKKLYFLNEEEKNRILSLHESRTKNQYLLNEATRSGFSTKINDICKAGTYGTGDFTENNVNSFTDSFLKWLKPNSGYLTIKQFNAMSQTITNMKNIANFCKISKKFQEIGLTKQPLINELDRFTYENAAFASGIEKPLNDLIKNSEALKQKSEQDYAQGVDGTQSKDNSNKDYAALADTAIAKEKSKVGGGTNQVAGGTILPQVVTPDVVKQLRTMGGLTDTAATLTQKDINDLYALFFNNLPKK
jgi:hypothetical protein